MIHPKRLRDLAVARSQRTSVAVGTVLAKTPRADSSDRDARTSLLLSAHEGREDTLTVTGLLIAAAYLYFLGWYVAAFWVIVAAIINGSLTVIRAVVDLDGSIVTVPALA